MGGNLYFILDTKNGELAEIEKEIRNIIGNSNYKLTVPVISSSDSHKPLDLGKFTWIKADPVYNGLKQVLYEPESGERAFIGEIPPIHKNLSKVIDNIEIKNSKNWFSTEPVLLNENLISIIGEKGSVKHKLLPIL